MASRGRAFSRPALRGPVTFADDADIERSSSSVDVDPATPLLYVLSDDGVTAVCAERTDNSRKGSTVGVGCGLF
jgi:hypothetical protein